MRLSEDYWRVVEGRAAHHRTPPQVVVQGWRDRRPPDGPWAEHLRAALGGARTILDVGAGDRAWQDVLRALGVTAAYASCDPEPRHPHEHADLLAVHERFDAILMLELLEHLDAQSGVDLLAHAAMLLPAGGVLAISTPNPAHPTSFQQADVTHIRPWPAHDLASVLRLLGFKDVAVHRLIHVEARRRALVPVQKLLARLLGVDPADHLLAIARK